MLRRLFAFMIGAALLGGSVVAEASGKKNGKLELRVILNNDFDLTDPFSSALGGVAFYVSGVICKDPTLFADCSDTIGTFHCWGWLIGPALAVGPVSQEFDLNGRGKIQVQGIEDDGPRAVVGGTGDFRNVRGEATGFDFTNFTPEFIGTFKLIGAKK